MRYSLLSKLKRAAAIVVMSVVMLASLTGCGETKTIKSEDMKIEINKEYHKSSLANATWYYTSPDSLVMGIRSDKDDIEKSGLETNSINDYAEAYIRANDIPQSPAVKTRGDYVYFEYNRKVSSTEYSYFTCVYDDGDAFWMVSFACYKELYNEYKTDFFESADSVVFEE